MTEPEQRYIDAATEFTAKTPTEFNGLHGSEYSERYASFTFTMALARLLAETEAAQHERTKRAAIWKCIGTPLYPRLISAIRALTLADVNGGERAKSD